MPRFHAEIAPALTHAFAELRDARHTNPAWFPFVDRDALAPLALEEPERELVRRALVAPVVAALGVTLSGTQEELPIALDGDRAVRLTRDGEGPHEWMDVPAESVEALLPDLAAALLPEGSRLSAPPRMTALGQHTALRLTAARSPPIRRASTSLWTRRRCRSSR